MYRNGNDLVFIYIQVVYWNVYFNFEASRREHSASKNAQ